MILETERTILRNWREDDLADYHHLNSDPRIMRLFPHQRTLDECVERMAMARKTIDELGFGWAAIELKESGQIIGIAGLLKNIFDHSKQFSEYEIGWRLRSEYWGKGLANEAATAWMNYAFNTLNEPAIIATAVHQNEASIALMKRLGMKFQPPAFDYPFGEESYAHLQPSVLYLISALEWSSRNKLRQ